MSPVCAPTSNITLGRAAEQHLATCRIQRKSVRRVRPKYLWARDRSGIVAPTAFDMTWEMGWFRGIIRADGLQWNLTHSTSRRSGCKDVSRTVHSYARRCLGSS